MKAKYKFECLQRCWCLRVYVFCVCVQAYPPVVPGSGQGDLDHVSVSVDDVSYHNEFTDSTVTVTLLRSVTSWLFCFISLSETFSDNVRHTNTSQHTDTIIHRQHTDTPHRRHIAHRYFAIFPTDMNTVLTCMYFTKCKLWNVLET